jgi:hypothetical protein
MESDMSVIIALNQTAGDLALTQLPVPDNEIPALGSVRLTNFATVGEIQSDAELRDHIRGGDVLLQVNGVTLTQAESVEAVSTYVHISAAYIAQYLRSSDQLISTTASPIIFDVSNFEDANYSRTGELITILTAGVYSISYSVYFDTNANARRTVDCWVDRSVNSGVSYSEIVPSRAASYARNQTDDTSNTSCTFYAELGRNDIVRLIADSTGTNGSANGIGNRMWISLQYMRA